MDNEKSDAQIDGSKQQSALPVSLNTEPLIGNWTIEKNFPYGFVLRNTQGKGEFHFWHDSNDWATCAVDGRATYCVNGHGSVNLQPILCDKESTQKMEKISQLKTKGVDLSPDESLELLTLLGIIKGDK